MGKAEASRANIWRVRKRITNPLDRTLTWETVADDPSAYLVPALVYQPMAAGFVGGMTETDVVARNGKLISAWRSHFRAEKRCQN